MSLEEFDDLNLPDAEPVDPALEVGSLPKYDMHLYKSSLTKSHDKWLTKCYGILADLHPRVVREGMTMEALPNDAIGLYAHHFQQGELRGPYAMFCRHHDSSVAYPFPKPNEFNTSDVAKLREVVIVLRKPPPSLLYATCLSHVWKHAGRAFSLKDPNGKGNLSRWLSFYAFPISKVVVGSLLPPGSARVAHLSTPADQLKDIPPKTYDMVKTKIPCRKVLDDKEKKIRKAEAMVAANAPDAGIQAEGVAGNKGAGKEGTSRKKRMVRLETLVHPDSEHASSPVPLNYAKPLEALANEEHVFTTASGGRMVNVDPAFANEGHGDNEGGLSGLRT
uniref:Uncharacterized protein n=1 Tax=Tanacetum cinerariifolium TaxID=118510 RepID=A0A699IU32_TANCI|nr:hypothetical protein [Tanacetum cinerariifolium]